MNPEAKELYRRAGIDPVPTTDDMVEIDFERSTASDKSPPRYAILSVYRQKVGDKEFLTYNMNTIKKDTLGNDRSNFKLYGKDEVPKFTHKYNPETNTTYESDVSGKEIKYKHPFSPSELDKIMSKNTESVETKFFISYND